MGLLLTNSGYTPEQKRVYAAQVQAEHRARYESPIQTLMRADIEADRLNRTQDYSTPAWREFWDNFYREIPCQ